MAGGRLAPVVTGEKRVLDADGVLGIFAPNGDVIVASRDNTLTRYCVQ